MREYLKPVLMGIFSLTVLLGCSKEPEAWKEARQVGSVQALESFLELYPDGQHATDARSALREHAAEAQWSTLSQTLELSDIEEFVSSFPDYSRFHEAKATLERLYSEQDWSAIVEAPSSEAVTEYISKYPQAPNIDEANYYARIYKYMQITRAEELQVVPATLSDTSELNDGIAFSFDEKFENPGLGMRLESMSLQNANRKMVFNEAHRVKGSRVRLFMALTPQQLPSGQKYIMWLPIGFWPLPAN